MSQRVKKPGRLDESQGKRRRRRPSGSDGEEDGTRSGSNSGGNSSFPSIGGMWTPRHLSDLKVSSIYNRNSAEAPAELYRKDLISAMKLADSEPLTPEEYWLITDPWKQEWEKGVQVPVNPESLPEPEVVVISPVNERSHDFRLPKKKYIRVTHDDFFNPDYHQLVSTAARAEKVCSYDLDDVDAAWLSCANADRGMQILPVISEFLMEQVIEELELQCWEQVQTILKSQEGLGIEYDENVICDVCRSPESEEGNEMVFCDACNICVHQACYGITTIPSGSWLCRTCTLGIRPTCVLCPNMGGAMKATRSGQKWAHVACAIWIPEVSIGSVEKMEPITKISAIPQSRWSLICVLCKDKTGACIQCSVKTCKTAYHVTCAFKSGLEMKPIIVDENAEDGIKLRSYCQKHSVNTKKEKATNSGSEDDGEKRKARAMTAEERNQARAEKLQQIEAEFYKYVRLKDVSQNLAVDMDIVLLIYNYWKLKRKSLNNRPLVPPRPETTQLLTQQQEQDLEQMKMFVQLRQDLERVRNLCYMVSRREKLSRTYFRLREQTFQKQVAILGEKSMDITNISPQERCAILDANHGPSIYDQIYSQNGANGSEKDYETLVSLIAGEDKKDRIINGVIKPKKSSGLGSYMNSGVNPYKRQFVNGARRKNLLGESCSSLSESEVSATDSLAATTSAPNRKLKLSPSSSGRKPLSYLFDTDSSVDEGNVGGTDLVSTIKGGTEKGSIKTIKGRSRPIKQTQKLVKKSSTSDSDELELPGPKAVGKNTRKSDAPIYSDSDSDESSRRHTSPTLATKAAVKEFTRKSNKKEASVGGLSTKVSLKGKVKGSGRKKKDFEPTGLIVPQREAAKKASESIRSVKPKKDATGVETLGNEPFTVPPMSPLSRVKERDDSSDREGESIFGLNSDKEKNKRRKNGEKAKSPGRKGLTKKPNRTISQPPESELLMNASDSRDQYDFDGSNDGSKNAPSYVPQRQAAKKAAEHIRSGLSNIVAARLIIEDEMEAARKKTKGDKNQIIVKKCQEAVSPDMLTASGKKMNKNRGKSSPLPEDLSHNATVDKTLEDPSKSRAKKRALSKGGDEAKGKTKSGKKDLMSTEENGKKGDTDWPFLDRGSQSACRRSRERSSSSSSSSSSGSSSSDSSSSSRSSASSRSSSPASASPKSNTAPRKATPIESFSSAASKIINTPRGPSRKLKTSDRSPGSGTEYETPKGKKPPPKSGGPSKPRPGRAPASGLHSATQSHPEQQQSSSHDRDSRRHSRSSSSRTSSSPSPSSSTRKRDKSSEEEIKRRTRESSEIREKSKKNISNSIELRHKSNSTRATKTKALLKTIGKTPSSGILDLSSDSESESSKALATKSPKHIPSQEKEYKEGNSLSASNTPAAQSDLKGSKSGTTKGKKKIGGTTLSESENEGAENEKENSCLTPEASVLESSSSNSKNKAQNKSVISSCATSILSPLTPSSENKEQSSYSKSSDTEPDPKRARLESSSSGPHVSHNPLNSDPSSGTSLHSLLGSQHAKPSLFSPTRTGHESELIDFDSELYDLARSVSADYSQCDDDGIAGGSGTLPFSFSQNFLCREDTGEDSAQATLNLVEKLRLQHARKSGCPRSSIDGSEDASKSPIPQNIEKDSLTLTISSGGEVPLALQDEAIFEELSKSDGLVSKFSPEKDKSTQGDERWAPSKISPEISKPLTPLVLSDQNQKLLHQSESMSEVNNGITTTKDLLISGYDKGKDQHTILHEMCKQQSTSRTPQIHRVEEESEKNEHTKQTTKSSKEHLESEVHIHNRDDSFGPSVSIGISNLEPTSPIMISPGAKLPHGVHFVPTSYQNNSSHPPFYPVSGTPSIANVVNSLTTAVGSNSSFFRPHSQLNITSNSSSLLQQTSPSSLSPGFSRQSFTSATQFLHSQQQLNQKTKESSSTISPGIVGSQNRTQDFADEKVITDSIASSGMPPLAKPSIASPSMILAANNVKNIIPPPPPQSTVAQIIENVVNNHTINTNYAMGAQELLSTMLGLNSSAVGSLGVSSGFTSQGSRNKKSPMKSPFSSGISSNLESDLTENISNGSERIRDGPISRENCEGKNRDIHLEGGSVQSNAASPRGRGRRATTPRAVTAKNDKILTTSETNGLKGKGRGQRKDTSSTSPARAKQPGSRRGGGRGKGKGKVVVTRKDLAGTVYDIDFDEFEENVDEKLDLRMLRERRKSSDVHGDVKLGKSETLLSPPDVRSPGLEISPKTKDFDLPRTLTSHQKGLHHVNISSNNECTITPIFQSPLPGPVDMRTYSFGSGTTESNFLEGNKAKTENFPRKQKAIDIASAFSASSGKQPIMSELEELDQTLEALTSAPIPSFSKSSNIQLPSQQFSLGMNSDFGHFLPKSISAQIIPGIQATIEHVTEPEYKSSGDFSRNQLKVKIKGPFLDANYGSHSITGDVSAGPQHFQNSFHHPINPSHVIMNTPTNNTSNLRRMRKKELLRQYWTQDMNMDGSACGSMYDPELSGVVGNSLSHPMINRSVITIPKAIASMANMPTKEDYRESLPGDNLLGNSMSGMSKDTSGIGQTTEKKKRSRGMREMVALGILTGETPKERRRDRMDANMSGLPYSNEMMGKKKGKGNKRPIRSTFIPPTLVGSDASSGDKKDSNMKINTGPINTVVTAVNHPTPKLKIKFGDLSKAHGGGSNLTSYNHVLSDSSDKETPNKKAKGRPPKKRGISELVSVSVAPPTMEELKRQSMKFREMVMQDFAVEERKEILKLKGTRKHKKHKKKGETDEGSPDVKVITEGSTKLILRFGKARIGAGGNGIENPTGNDSIDTKIKVPCMEVLSDDLMAGENDSGFTDAFRGYEYRTQAPPPLQILDPSPCGLNVRNSERNGAGESEGSSGSVSEFTSEGSSGSVSELTGASKERLSSTTSIKVETNSSSSAFNSDVRPAPITHGTLLPSAPVPCLLITDLPCEFPSQEGDVKPPINQTEDFSKNSNDKKIMPLRLKLSRCFEGYALKKKKESCAGEGGPPASTPTKQSDSCEVR